MFCCDLIHTPLRRLPLCIDDITSSIKKLVKWNEICDSNKGEYILANMSVKEMTICNMSHETPEYTFSHKLITRLCILIIFHVLFIGI